MIKSTLLFFAVAASSTAYADNPIKVVKAGAEPKRPLRIVAKAGEHHALDMTVTNSRAPRTLKGQLLPAEPMPGIHTTMDYTVKSVDANGTAAIDFAYTAFEVTGTKVPAANAKLVAQLVGTKGHFSLTPTGELTNAAFDMPATMAPELKAMLEASKDSLPQLADRLPDEALGIGAVWETKKMTKVGELEVAVVTSHELVKADGKAATIKLTQRIDGKSASAKDGTITIHGTGTGSETLDLAGSMPSEIKLSVDQDIDLVNGATHLQQRASMAMAIVRK